MIWRCPWCGVEKRGNEMTPYAHIHDGETIKFEPPMPVVPPPAPKRRGRPPKPKP